MEIEVDLTNIEKGLKELFTQAFVLNCNLDDESVTSEESRTLEELTSAEVLENFKDLIISLLKFKKDCKASDTVELVQKSEQFESMLQKLEAEVRNHIRIEHQLKLHIENHQNRIDELEKTGALDKNLIKELEEKNHSKRPIKTGEIERLKKDHEDKIKNLLEVIDKKDKYTQKIDYENTKLRNLLEEKIRDFEMVKKELVKLSKTPKSKDLAGSASSDKLKQKFELRKFCNVKVQGSKNERKSMGQNELEKLNVSPILKKDSKREEEKNTAKNSSKGHFRSNSDQKLLISKRTTSR